MIVTPKWESKFQLDNGTWVFVPNNEMRKYGNSLKDEIESIWSPPSNYYHLRNGGHVLSLKQHLSNKIFARADIRNFFGQINKSRITRNLKPFFPYEKAREISVNSTVLLPGSSPKEYILPYGFVQSPIIAALCLEKSRLGSAIRTIAENLTITVYVDDLVISGIEKGEVEDALQTLQINGKKAGFPFNETKLEGPSNIITSFNIELSPGKLQLADYRMQMFKDELDSGLSKQQVDGILGYARTVNLSQHEELLDHARMIYSS